MLKPGGYSHGDIVKIGNVNFLYADTAQREQVLSLFRKQGYVSDHEVRFKRKDGSVYDALLSLSKVNINGQPCIQALVEDITSQKKTREALHKSEQRFRTLIEKSYDALILLDAKGNITYYSPSFTSMMGYTSEERQGHSSDMFIHPDDREQYTAGLRELVRKPGATTQNVYRIKHKDGSWRWIEGAAQNLLHEPSVQAIVIHARDVTAQKQAGKDILFRNQDLALVNAINEAANRGENLQFIIQLISKRTEEMFDTFGATFFPLSPDGQRLIMQTLAMPATPIMQIEKMLGRPIPHIELSMKKDHAFRRTLTSRRAILLDTEAELQDMIAAFVEAAPLGEKTRARVMKFIPTLIKILGYKSQAIAPLISEGQLVGTFAIGSRRILTQEDLRRIETIAGQLTSIFIRKQAEDALLENEARLRSLYENATVGFYRTAPDGQILMANPAVVRMLEYKSFEELAERNLEKDGYHADYSRQEFKDQIEREGTIQGRETFWKTKNGKAIYVRESARVARDEKGKVLYYEGTVEDITERKKAEDALRASESELRAIFSAIPDLIMVLDKDGRYLKIAPSNPNSTYVPMKDLLGKKMGDIFSRQKALRFVQHIRRALRTRKPVRFEYALLVGDKILWFSGITAPLTKDTVIWVARDITSEKQIEEQTRRRLIELQALYESGLAFGRTLNVQEIGEQIIHIVETQLSWHHAVVRLRRENSDEVEVIAFSSGGPKGGPAVKSALNKIARVGEGLSGWSMEHGEVVRVGDLTKDARYMETFSGMRSGLYVPMKIGKIAIGVISAESDKIEAFDENDERLLTTLATQAAAAIQNGRLFHQSQQRAIESATLYEITSELATQGNVSSLLKTVANDIATLLDVPGGVVYLYNTQHAELEVVATTDPNAPVGTQMLFGEGTAGRIAQSREPMIIEDYKTWKGAAPQFKDQPFYSVLGVPMLYSGELIGVLVAHGLHATSSAKENNRKFTERDMRLLTLFASAAAGAVYSARLLESERKRRQEAETLQNAAAALTSSLNVEQILNSLLDGLAQVIPYSSSAVFIEEGKSIRLTAERGHSSNNLIGQLFPLEDSMEQYVLELRAPLILEDAQADPRFHTFGASQVIRGWMGLPLIAHEKVIGYLVMANDQPNSYNKPYADLAMAFANQAAIAIENARLFQDAVRYAQRWATLHAVSQEFARVGDDLEQVYVSIHNAAAKLLTTEAFAISLTDDKHTHLDAVYLYDRAGRAPAMRIPFGKGFSSQVVSGGVSVRINDDWDTKVEAVHFGSEEAVRSILAVPLRVSDKVIGAMSVQSYKPNAYGSEDQLLLELLATQAAIAIENARLFEETRQHAREFETLYETTRQISTQQDSGLLLQMIMERATDLLHSKNGGIYLYDAEHKELELSLFTDMNIQKGTRLKVGEGGAGRVALNRQPLIINDYQTWEGRSAQYKNVPFRAVLQVPMLYGGELIGVLTVNEYDDSERKFTHNDEDLLSLFAAHAASIVHSTMQFEQISRRAEELGMMAQISSALRTASTRAEMLPIISEQLTSLLKADCTLFAAFNPTEKELMIEQASGPIASLMGQRVKQGEGLFGHLIQSGERYISADVKMNDRLGDPQLLGDLRSVAIIPLIVQEERIGLIGVGREEKNGTMPPAFSEREINLLTAIGDMIANAIQRASLHEETVRNNEQLIIVNQLGRSLTETLNTQTVYERLAHSILNLLANTPTVYIFICDEENKNIRLMYAMHDERELDVSKAVNIPLAQPGKGTLSQIVHTGEPMIVNQLGEFYKNKNVGTSLLEAAALQTESALYAPIISSNRVVGVIQVQSHLPRRYTPSDARLLGLVANTAAAAIQNAHLFDQLEERVEQFAALHSIDLVIGSTTDLRVSLQVVLESIIRLLKIDAAGILLYNPDTLNLEYAGGAGFRSDVTHSVVRLGEGPAGRAALTRQMIDVPDLAKADLPLPYRQMIEREGFISYRGLALVAKGEVKGVLEFYHRSALPSNAQWSDLLNLLAGQAAIAMDNAMLFSNLERVNTELELAYDATIEGWSQALELRDHDTSGHTRRMLDITIALARHMGIPDLELPNIRRGVLLHDIGKMGVPDQILLKPGPLDEEEWKIMRRHPQNAYNLLSKITYLRSALDIPYCHHEKWDGSGYPRGLKGEQIPLAARMFSVVDVYDALSFDRPYRSAWPKEKVIAYIKEQSGIYFDPRMVEAFLKII